MERHNIGYSASSTFCLNLKTELDRKRIPFNIQPNTTIEEAKEILAPFLGNDVIRGLDLANGVDSMSTEQWQEIQNKLSLIPSNRHYPKRLLTVQRNLHEEENEYLKRYGREIELIQSEGIKHWKIVGNAAYSAALAIQATRGIYPSKHRLLDYLLSWGTKDSVVEAAKGFKYAMLELRSDGAIAHPVYLPIFENIIPPKS